MIEYKLIAMKKKTKPELITELEQLNKDLRKTREEQKTLLLILCVFGLWSFAF